jgi:hypothetical protein
MYAPSTAAALSGTASPSVETVLPVVSASTGPEPSVETRPPLSLRPEDRDDVVVYSNQGLPPDLEAIVRAAALESASSANVGLPLGVEVVATIGTRTFAIITVVDGSLYPLVVSSSGAEIWSTPDNGDIAVHYGERNLGFPTVEIVWMGLPPDASYVGVDFHGLDEIVGMSNKPVPVMAASAFVAIPKPYWHQYVTLTAHGANGTPIAETEVLVDGSKCSAGRLPVVDEPFDQLDDAVESTRGAMLAQTYRCGFAAVASIAIGDGPFFGVSTDTLVDELRERDRRDALMSRIYAALLADPKTSTNGETTTYTFSDEGVHITIDDAGRWIHAIG